MATKDKLVDLEDLKALKDWIVGRMDMYEDITSTLTWSNATWIPKYDGTKDTTATKIAGVKVAKISVTKGEKYKVYYWTNGNPGNDDPRTIPFALADVSDNIVSTKGEYPRNLQNGTSDPAYAGTSAIHFGESQTAIPAKAKYLYIFDFSGHSTIGSTAGDIIVEKAI